MDSQNSTLVIHNAKFKIVGLLAVNLICIVSAVFMAKSASEGIVVNSIGWLGVVLFSFAFIIQIRRYIRREPLMKADDSGIYLPFFGLIPWNDITGYTEYKSMLQIYVANESHYIDRLPPAERMIANLNKKFGFSSITVATTCCSSEQKTLMTNALKKRITVK